MSSTPSTLPPGASGASSTQPPSTRPPVRREGPRTTPTSPVRDDAPSAWLLPMLLTAAAYAAFGLAALPLAIAPGFASPLFPAAGIALACVLVYGPRVLPGIALGSFVVNASLVGVRGGGVEMLLLPFGIALGAAAQAALGRALVRRAVRGPLTLTEPRDIADFLAASAVSSLVAASVATPLLGMLGVVPADVLPFTWATWWIGDLAGILVVTPVALTLIGRPRSEWAPRRLAVGLTLALVTATLAFGTVMIERWSRERLQQAFVHDASSASLVLGTELQEPLRALEALHGMLAVARGSAHDEVRAATRTWLAGGAARAMGYAERRRRDEADVDANAGERRSAGFDDGEVIAVRLLEPPTADGVRPGLNALSLASAPAAIARSVQTGKPAATAPGAVVAGAASAPASTLVVFQSVHDGRLDASSSVADRRAALRGVAFVVVDVREHVERIAGAFPPHLALCVVDADHLGTRRRLAGPLGCETENAGLVHERPVSFAGRQWGVRVLARAADLPGARDRSAWIFSALGTFSAAMLGGALLTVTGRTRRIESAVRERTAALRAQVNEREVAEAALRASEQRFRNILDNVPIGVVYTDLKGRVIQANPAFCALTGYAEAALTALAPRAFAHPDDAAEEAALTARLVAGEIGTYRRQGRYVTESGDSVAVRCTVSLLKDQRNRPWRIVGVVEDITERLKLEEAERAREAAEGANRAKSEFLSRMSHELRTPLNAMLGFAQLLDVDRNHPLDPSQRPWVGQIQSAGWHLLEMINDVLDLSRIEAGTLRLQSETLDLGELIPASVALVAATALVREIRISQALGPEALRVVGDATRVKQIFTNLLSNAVKYNVEGGRIHVATRRDGETIEIAVTDTGLGMSDEQQASLWRPFNRLGRERSVQEGTGIGLVIARRLVELMGGSIRVKSIAGEGSTFIVELPAAPDGSTVPGALDADEEAVEADYHRRVVHYIEDNETNVEVMRGILALRPQVDLSVSLTAHDGLAAVRAEMPHLLLLDMHLPDADGLALLRELKGDPATEAVPVVVVSADALGGHMDAALAAGAEAYLTKPVVVAELLATVDSVLDRVDTGFRPSGL